MSLTTGPQCPIPTLTFDTQQWEEIFRPQIQEYIVIAALPCAFYGIFVLLCGASIYSLVQLNTTNRKTAVILSLVLLALFCSTTIFTVTNFIGMLEQVFQQFFISNNLWDGRYDPLYADELYLSPSIGEAFIFCTPTVTLTLNILLGDAIVCWRACIIWKGNKIVMGVCVLLLLTTFALGTADTTYNCPVYSSNGGSWQPDPHADGLGSLYQGFSYGVAATVLSLSTNLFATFAVTFKAWQSRRALKQYVVMGPMASQMEKVFSLLVESGVIYCALWVVVLAWQAREYKAGLSFAGTNDFGDIFNVFVSGALVPLIAIYPTAIIVLVALNRSHIENAFPASAQSSFNRLPLRPLTVAVNTTITTLSDSQQRGMFDRVLVIRGEGSPSGDSLEGSSPHIADEGKLGDIV